MYQAIVFLPLIGALIAGLFGRVIGPRPSELVTTTFLFISAILSWIAFVKVGFGHHDERIVRAQAEQRARAWNMILDELHHVALIGTPAQCAEHLQQFVDLGTEHFVLSIDPPYDMPMLELYVGEVAAILRQK